MSISAYCGLPGAGKSHGLVAFVIIRALQQGRRVVHNLPLIDVEVRKIVTTGELIRIPDGQSADEFIRWFRNEHAGALLILDEAWRYWGAGVKASTIPEHQREFFAMHRHLVGQTDDGRSTDIYLCCQNLGQCARFIVDLVEETFIYTKATSLGLSKRYRCDTYSGAITGPKGPINRRLSYFLGKYDPKIYACYKSHTLSTTGAAGSELKVDDRATIFKSYKFKIAVAAAALVPIMLFAAIHEFQTLGKPKGLPSSEASKADPKAQTIRPIAPAKPSGPQESKRWRLAGLIEAGFYRYALIESVDGPRRLPVSACAMDQQGQRTCLFNGEIIAEWTGVHDRGAIQTFVADSITPDSTKSRP